MTRFKFWLLIALFSIIAIVGLIFFKPFASDVTFPAQIPRIKSATAPVQSDAKATSTVAPLGLNGLSAPGSTSKSLIDEYYSMMDGRALTLQLWTREGEGGKYYASAIADFCAGISKFVPEALIGQASLKDVAPERQLSVIAAIDLIHRRCGQFTQTEFEKYSRRGLLNDKSLEDPLVKIVKAFNDPSKNQSPEAHLKSLGAILDTQDPMVLDDIGMKLSLQTGTDGAYLYFDGKNYPVKDSPAIAAAYLLVPCGLGLKCDGFDTTLALACASGSKCYKDRYQKIFEEIALGNNDTYAQILEFEARIVTAIKNKDITKFVPNR